ncbi:ribosomal RNA processing protein 1 homolog A isoform X2 [Canis lupus familiaris]|nr:ribosomal RNA processing protein 1 homolog A isoform X2 [Canis lupus familiaris]
MNREWTGIDRLRLDKFYMLMRMVLNESLKALKTQGWEERQIEQLLELLTTEILHPDSQAPSGVKSHFLEIFLEELSKVGAAELTADQNLRFIDPFCTIAARTKDSLVLHNITRGIFEAIVEQAPFAIEDLLNEVDSQEEEEDDDDEDNEDGMSEDDECKQDVPSGKPGSLRGAACNPSNEPAEDGEDSVGPVLQFDYEAVASRLFAVASQQSTPSQNRKRLYKVIRKLQDLAEGLFPEDDVPEKAYRNLQEEGRDQRTKKRLPTSTSHKSGKGRKEDSCPDLSSGSERMTKRRRRRRRRGSGAEPTGPQEQPGVPGQRGPRKKRRRSRAGARVKVAGSQELQTKQQLLQSRK